MGSFDSESEPEINQYDRVVITRFGKKIETTVGRLIVSKVVFFILYDNKYYEYQDVVYTKKVLKEIMKLLSQFCVENKGVTEADINDTIDISTELSLRLSTMFNASITMSMMLPDDNFKKKKKEILSQAYKKYAETNDLHDIESAENEVLNFAKSYFANDDMMEIYQSGASADMDNDWKTMNVSMGPLPNLDGTSATLVPEALAEGIPLSYTAALTNTAQKGAVDRAKNTALAGALYKDIVNGMNSIYGIYGDCGTKEGVEMITSDKWAILNKYAIVGGKSILITLDNVNKFLNKKFIMRSPLKCKAKNGHFCSCCIGEYPFKAKKVKKLPIGIFTAELATGILNMFMKSTHDLHIRSFIIEDLNKYVVPAGQNLFSIKEDPIDKKIKIYCNQDIEWRIPNSAIDQEYNYYNVLAHGTILSVNGKESTIVLGTEVKTTPTYILKTGSSDNPLESHTIFRYNKGDVFLIQNHSFRREMTVFKMFNMFLSGNMSNLLPLELHIKTLKNAMATNKGINAADVSIELILASLARDASDMTKPARETGTKNYKFISTFELGSTGGMFNALFSGYANKSILINIAKDEKDQVKNVSPMETALRY